LAFPEIAINDFNCIRFVKILFVDIPIKWYQILWALKELYYLFLWFFRETATELFETWTAYFIHSLSYIRFCASVCMEQIHVSANNVQLCDNHGNI
jgi:hypothetical protein